LETVAQRVNGGVTIACDMLDEDIDIPEAIEREVAKTGIDLIVMSSHGRGALKRFWLGSIADNVYRTSSVPVLLARPQEKNVDYEHETQIKRILVTLDGSAQAEDVLEAALSFAQGMDAELQLVRVISNPKDQHVKTNPSATTGNQMELEPAHYLEILAAKLRDRGARVQTQVLVSPEPAEAILQAAETADLIAMQTHARRGVSRLVHGSVADRVVHDSTVPVLINRPHKR
jgi:nucleotide-binding universal stress UspA family protein